MKHLLYVEYAADNPPIPSFLSSGSPHAALNSICWPQTGFPRAAVAGTTPGESTDEPIYTAEGVSSISIDFVALNLTFVRPKVLSRPITRGCNAIRPDSAGNVGPNRDEFGTIGCETLLECIHEVGVNLSLVTSYLAIELNIGWLSIRSRRRD